jgi:8-oxo-dGTP pyrophosphatase MutT (NUDIX family)
MKDLPVMDQSKKWQSKVRGVVAENPWFSVLEQDVVLPTGESLLYHTVRFPRPAVGIVVRRGEEYLLIHQYRFIVDEFVWSIPSGGVGEGESPDAAVRRELLEETGYEVGPLTHLHHYYPSFGSTDQRFEIFLAEEPKLVSDRFDENEVISRRWFHRGEIVALIGRNGVLDGLSLTALLLVLLRDRDLHAMTHPLASAKA